MVIFYTFYRVPKIQGPKNIVNMVFQCNSTFIKDNLLTSCALSSVEMRWISFPDNYVLYISFICPNSLMNVDIECSLHTPAMFWHKLIIFLNFAAFVIGLTGLCCSFVTLTKPVTGDVSCRSHLSFTSFSWKRGLLSDSLAMKMCLHGSIVVLKTGQSHCKQSSVTFQLVDDDVVVWITNPPSVTSTFAPLLSLHAVEIVLWMSHATASVTSALNWLHALSRSWLHTALVIWQRRAFWSRIERIPSLYNCKPCTMSLTDCFAGRKRFIAEW